MEEIGIFLVCGVIGFVTLKMSVVLKHRIYGSFDEVLPWVIILGALALYLSYGAVPYVVKLAACLQGLCWNDIDFTMPEMGIAEKLSYRDVDAMFVAIPVAFLMAFVIDSTVLLYVHLLPADDRERHEDLQRLLKIPLIFLIPLSPFIVAALLIVFVFAVLVLVLEALVMPSGQLMSYWARRQEAMEAYRLTVLEEVITIEGDDFHRLQLRSARDRRFLLVTLTNHRVYYGMTLLELRQPQMITSHGASRQLQMELYFSGYRDSATKDIKLTVVYPRPVEEPQEPGEPEDVIETNPSAGASGTAPPPPAPPTAAPAAPASTLPPAAALATTVPAPAAAPAPVTPAATDPVIKPIHPSSYDDENEEPNQPSPISLLEIPYSQIVSMQVIEENELLKHAVGTNNFWIQVTAQAMAMPGLNIETAEEIVKAGWTPDEEDTPEVEAAREDARFDLRVKSAVTELKTAVVDVLTSVMPQHADALKKTALKADTKTKN